MTATASAFPPQMMAPPPSVQEVIDVQAALMDVLAEEVLFMDTMQIQRVGLVQERKLKLTALLERYTRYIQEHPEWMEQVTPQQKAKLRQLADTFQDVMRKNYETLLVARAVNRAVVRCVTQAATDKQHNPIYNAAGVAQLRPRATLSVTLNQTI